MHKKKKKLKKNILLINIYKQYFHLVIFVFLKKKIDITIFSIHSSENLKITPEKNEQMNEKTRELPDVVNINNIYFCHKGGYIN